MTDTDTTMAVARGLALLNVKVPDWRTRVDAERLDMADPSACVVGQLYADRTMHPVDSLGEGN